MQRENDSKKTLKLKTVETAGPLSRLINYSTGCTVLLDSFTHIKKISVEKKTTPNIAEKFEHKSVGDLSLKFNFLFDFTLWKGK